MKKTVAFLLLLFTISLRAQVANVTYNLIDFVSTPQNYASLTITPLYNSGLSGGSLVASQARTFPLSGTNSITVSNVVMGYSYAVTLNNYNYTSKSSWTNIFPANLSGNIDGSDWMFYNVVLPGWVVDGIVTNGSGGTPILGSTTVVVTPVGGSNQLSVSATVVTNTYNLRSFGAHGDATNAWGAMAVSNSTTFNVTSGNFTSADVGKFIGIKGADVDRRDWWTVITNVYSPTSIAVSNAVPVSYNLPLPGNISAMSSGYDLVYGAHDDSMAIQAWVNQVTNGGGKFYAPPGIYLVLNPPTNAVNSQIMVPISPLVAGNEVTYFEMFGSLGSAPGFCSGTPRVDLDPNTTVFVPNIGTSANPGQWAQGMPSSFLEFRTVGSLTPYGVSLGKVALPASGCFITNTLTWPVLHDFAVQGTFDPSAIMIDELGAQEGRGPKNVIVGTWYLNSYCPLPSNTNGFGFVGPCVYSGQAGDCRDLFVAGCYTGIDPGCTRMDYPVLYCCNHGIASMFTGGAPQVNHISEAQFTDCPIWVYGSGDSNFYSAAGNASSLFNPQLSVLMYAQNSVGESNPNWTTNPPYAIYDPSNRLNTAGCSDIAGWVEFAQVANGPQAQVLQGSNPSVFPLIDISACGSALGGPGTALAKYTLQPQVFGGTVWATNSLSISNGLVVSGSSTFNNGLNVNGTYLSPNYGINETMPSGYYLAFQSLNSGDQNDIGLGNNGSGRTTEWFLQTDDRYGDGNSVADLFFIPKQAGGANYNAGFGGLGGTVMLTTNGDESVLGSVRASNNVVAIGGSFLGNVGPATNALGVSMNQMLATNGNGGGLTNTTPATFAAEQYGVTTNNSASANAAILNGLLSACGTNGGGNVTLRTPGIYYCKPVLAVWPNTTVTLGGGVTLLASGTNEGMLYNVWYCPTNNSFSSGGTNYFVGNCTMATNVLTVTFTNSAGILSTNGLDPNYVGAVLIVNMGTNGQPFIWGNQYNWLPGSYVVTNVISNNLYLNRNICSGPATNMSGCIGYAMLRDALYDSCPSTIYGMPQATNSTYCSTNIIVQGPGKIDMNTPARVNTMQGYFCYSIWLRQTEFSQIRGDLKIWNCPIYATLFEDCADFIHRDVYLNSLRDGMHYAGPVRNGLDDNISGTCGDNMMVYCQGYGGVPSAPGTGYPIDSEPMVGFWGNGFNNSIIRNTTSFGGFNPVRLTGSTNAVCQNITIDGVHGFVGPQYAGNIQTGSGVTVFDDTGNTGMSYQNVLVKNVDIICATNTWAVYFQPKNLVNADVDGVVIQGPYGGVEVNNTSGNGGGGLISTHIRGVRMSPTLSNISSNHLIYVSGSYNIQDISISDCSLPASATPTIPTNGIEIDLSNAGAIPINLSGITLNDYNLYLWIGNSSANPSVNLASVSLSGGSTALPLIYASGGSPTFNFGGSVSFNNCSDRCIRFANNPNNGALTLLGSINYGNLSSDQSAPNNNGSYGTIRCNGGIHIYSSNDAPINGDIIGNVNSGSPIPSIYNSNLGLWTSLASLINGINQVQVVVTNTSGPHGWTNYFSGGILTNAAPW
jgi:hypothetical protein